MTALRPNTIKRWRRVEEVKALIDKKTIRAPFSGVLGIRAVNLGQYLQSGAQVAPLQSLDPIYVNFWLPQQYLGQIARGPTGAAFKRMVFRMSHSMERSTPWMQ